MDIKLISKTPLSPVDQDSNPILSLALIKEYLRVTHNQEDNKIQDIINSVVSYFEQKTGYRLTPATYEIKFTLRDSLRGDKRSDYSLADAYTDTSRFNPFGSVFGDFGLDYSHDFRLPLAPVPTQKPTEFKIYNSNGEVVFEDLSVLPDNFLFSFRDTPSRFRLLFNNSVPVITEASLFKMTIKTGSANFTPDIKQALIRYICKVYEYPDLDISDEDSIISDVLYRYDCSSSV